MELEVYSKNPNLLESLRSVGSFIAKSGLFGCDREEAGWALAWACYEEGMKPFALLRTYDIVDGKLRMKALAMLAEFRTRGGKHKWLATGDDGKMASIELTYDGQSIVSSFTIEQAQRAGLVREKSNWAKSAPNMLRARAISNGVNMLCPEIASGFGGDGEEESEVVARRPESLLRLLGEEVQEPEEDHPDLVPMADPPVPPAPIPPPRSEAMPKDGITMEMAEQVANTIGNDNMDAARSFLVGKRQWLKPTETLMSLKESRAKMILDNTPGFLKAVHDYTAALKAGTGQEAK